MRRVWRFPILAAVVMGTVVLARAAPPAPEAPGTDRDGHMSMKLEKTWFGVDVAEVDVWFDGKTRDQLRRLASGKRYSRPLADRIAREAMSADLVVIRLEFLRDVSLDQFLESIRKNLTRARDARLITQAIYDEALQRVRGAFGKFAERGFKDGDVLEYRARAGAVHTTMVSEGGATLLDDTTESEEARRALLAGYFAPRGEFREPLIKSLWG